MSQKILRCKKGFIVRILFAFSVNGNSPSPPGHQGIPENQRDTDEQYESWNDEILSTMLSPTSLRPIGAEHRATTSAGGVAHITGKLSLKQAFFKVDGSMIETNGKEEIDKR